MTSWRQHAPELKSLEGALDIRSRILTALEAAEWEPDRELQRAWLTFVVVGGGPTGVEMAGQIAEIARDTAREFHVADAAAARVLLVEAGERVLSGVPKSLSARADRALERLGVTPLLEHTVTEIEDGAVTITDVRRRRRTARCANRDLGCRGRRRRASRAPSRGPRAASSIAPAVSSSRPISPWPATRRSSRSGTWLPSAAVIGWRRFPESHRSPCSRAATPPRWSSAICAAGSRRRSATTTRATWRRSAGPEPSPTSGWYASAACRRGWPGSAVHLFYLIGVQNRLLVLTRWAFSFLTHGRGARLISGPGLGGRAVTRSPRTSATASR